MGTYFITPQNEGQDLNYIETFNGSLNDAVTRARKIVFQLGRLLKQGTITATVVNDLYTIEYYIDENLKLDGPTTIERLMKDEQ